MSSQEYLHKITMEYLGTSLHKGDVHDVVEIDVSYVNFYKKRLYAAVKQHINLLTRGKNAEIDSNDSLLSEYIDKKIKEFRIDDFADLQTIDLSNSIVASSQLDEIDDSNMTDPNSLLYNNSDTNSSTLDDFVIKKTIKTALAPNFPQQKDIMSKTFRYKGIKKRGGKV